MRVAEIAAYGPDRLVVLEAAYSRARGNSVVLTTANIGPPGDVVIGFAA